MQSEQYIDRLITSNPLFNEIMVMTRDSSNSRMKTRSGKLRSKTKQILKEVVDTSLTKKKPALREN
jgi:hypothetical protein